MAQVLADSGPPASRRFYLQPYFLTAVIFLIVLAFPSFLRKAQDWESVYVPAAERLAVGDDIFQQDFVYPPINAWLPLPFVGLPRLAVRLLWYAINMTAVLVLILGAWRLSGGGRLDGLPKVPGREHAIFWLGLACGISGCLDAITNQQTDIIVAALVIMGCLALVQQRDFRAALWFGLAAAIKCTPLLWAGYLAWRKKWVASAVVVVAAVGINFIPELTHPSETSATRLEDWGKRFLMPMADRKHDFGQWHCGMGGNQSAAGLCQRWLAYKAIWQDGELVGVPSESRATPETLKAVAWGVMLSLLLVGLVCTWKIPAGTESDLRLRPETGLQFGLVVILMVLLSPHSSKPHFCTLILPGFCVARAALTSSTRWLSLILAAALAGAMISNCDLVGDWLYMWGKWYGSLAWCSVFLFAGSCWALVRNRVAASVPTVERASELEAIRRAA
jgi:hypothetical protein